MTDKTSATLTDEERDNLMLALQEHGITPEQWEEASRNIRMIVELVNDNSDYVERLVDYIRREAEKDPRQGESIFEDDYLENILKRAMEAMEAPDKDLPALGYLMNGGGLQTFTRVLTSGGEPQQSSVTRSEKWETREHHDAENPSASTITFIRKNRGVEHAITITNPDVFFPGASRDRKKRGTIVTRKLLPFVLQKMTQQNYPEAVRIDLGELVRLEAYKSEETAYKGVTRFVQQMAATDLSWTRKSSGRGKKKEPTTSSGGSLFYHRRRQGSTVYIYVNRQFDLRELAGQFTVFPDWAYALKPGAFDLVRYVFYIARQKKNDIAETGKFNVSMEAVRIAMGLPEVDEVTNRRYRQLIRTPIEEAIAEVEQRVASVPEAKGRFFLTPHVDENATDIDKWLAGYVEVELRDEYVTLFTRLAEKQKELIAEATTSSGKGKKPGTRKGK